MLGSQALAGLSPEAPSPAMGLSYLSRRLPDRVRAAQAVRVLATIRSVLLVDRLVCYRSRAARRQDKPNRRSYRAERSRYREGWQRALATHGHQMDDLSTNSFRATNP